MAEWAAQAGAWGFKTQLLTPSTLAASGAPKYWSDDYGTRDQREAFARAGVVDYGCWREVKDACDSFGIEFLASPFDLHAVDVLADMGVRYFKVASGDITYRDLIRACRDAGEVILSTGASYYIEIQRALTWAHNATLLACTLAYPTPLAAAHLGRIERLRREFPGVPVGYSDHTSAPITAWSAAVLGARMLEVHYTHDKNADDVPDHRMAVDPDELRAYVDAAFGGVQVRGSTGLVPCPEESAAREGARRSAHAVRDLQAGERLAAGDVVWLRPDGPIQPWHETVGRVVLDNTRAGEQIQRLG